MRGFHQGQSNQMLTNRPIIVTQSDLGSSHALHLLESPYSGINRLRAFAESGLNVGLCLIVALVDGIFCSAR